MKNTALLFVLIAALSGCGRLTKVPEKERMIRKVYKVNLSRDEIYDRALEWVAKEFTSINESVVVKNKERGKIIGKGIGTYKEYFDILVLRKFSYAITIEVREKRYRVTLDNFIVYYDEREDRSSQAEFQFEVRKIEKKLIKILDKLHTYISQGGEQWEDEKKEKEDEW